MVSRDIEREVDLMGVAKLACGEEEPQIYVLLDRGTAVREANVRCSKSWQLRARDYGPLACVVWIAKEILCRRS